MNSTCKHPILRSVVFWVIAFVFTVSIATFQRKTGPTYPVSGEAKLGENNFHYELKRSHAMRPGQSEKWNLPVSIPITDSHVHGFVVWKRYKLDEPLHKVPLQLNGEFMSAKLPHQPPAGKLEYQVVLQRQGEEIKLPIDKPAVVRFRGDVPPWAMIPHIILMFSGLLLAVRTVFSAFSNGKTKTFAWVTLGLFIVGGLIFGPIVQKYAFGAFWTGWPFGEDWTDNKTLMMVVVWLIALYGIYRTASQKMVKFWTTVAMVATFAVYLVPHSMHGSELDYSSVNVDSLQTTSQKPLQMKIEDAKILEK